MKVAIVGLAKSRMNAPFQDPDWSIWGLLWDRENRSRADLLFDPHDKLIDKWSDLHCPCYWQYEDEGLYRRYPLEEVTACIGRDWYDSTIAYMVALAIYQRVDTIGLWGVNMSSKSEYAHQRANVSWLLGLAEGRGIKVKVPQTSPLLKRSPDIPFPVRYGYAA